ncbi:hypothetical protein JW948_15490, partial [bacterium]|nr:hypothetical protein [bacterium]
WYDRNRLVLVVNDSARARIAATPEFRENENQSKREWDLSLDSAGNLDGHAGLDFSGTPAQNLRHVLRLQPDWVIGDWCRQEILHRFPNADTGDFDIQGLEDLAGPLHIRIGFHVPAADDSSRCYTVYRPGSWSRYDWHTSFAPKERFSDVAFQFPLIIEDDVRFSYDASWTLKSDPGSHSITRDFGGYFCRIFSEKTGQVRYRRYFRLSGTRIDRTDYDALRTFLNEVAVLDDQQILIFKE